MVTFLNTTLFRVFRVGRVIGRIFRVLRVSRGIRLAKSVAGLRRLVYTLYLAVPSLANVGSLLLLLFFIYSIIGVFLFGEITVRSKTVTVVRCHVALPLTSATVTRGMRTRRSAHTPTSTASRTRCCCCFVCLLEKGGRASCLIAQTRRSVGPRRRPCTSFPSLSWPNS